MLILRRRIGEVINLYQNGKLVGRVVLTDVRGDSAKIGLEFPPSVSVVRGELEPFDEIQRAGGGGRRVG